MVAEANGVCVTRILGECVDGKGGRYIGEVDVTLVYVGDVQTHLNDVEQTVSFTQDIVKAWAECAQETGNSECDPEKEKEIEAEISDFLGEDGRSVESPKGGDDDEPPTGDNPPLGFWGRIINFVKSLF